MFPKLFQFDGFALYTWGLLVGAGFIVGVEFSVREARRAGMDVGKVRKLLAVFVLAAVFGSRLLFILLYPRYFLQYPIEIFRIWKGGMVFSGGLTLAVVVGFLFCRRLEVNPWQLFDIVAPAIALGDAIGRFGCLAAGCCYGKPTDLPWGIVFTHPDTLAPRGVALHPTQLYSSAVSLLIFLMLLAFRSRKKWHGQVICLYVMAHSVSRFAIERFRGDYRGVLFSGLLTTTEFVTLCLLAASVAVWVYRSRLGARADRARSR